jgi:hypothetical protein
MKNPAILLTFGLLLGCEDPLKPAQRIDEARILAARVSTATGDAHLVPGEGAQAEVLLAGPEGPLAARLAFRVCPAAESQRGVPYCAGDAIATGTIDPGAGPVAFELPSTLRGGARLALLGAACLDGEPDLGEAPLGWSCSSGAQPLGFTFDAYTLDVTPQTNPDLAGLSVKIAQLDVELSPASTAATCDAGEPELAAGETHVVQLELGDAAREPQETLQLSHFSTRGDYERHFSFAEAEQEPRISLTWKAPSEAGPVKQYLVVRDGRGGVSWATWNFCVR